MEEYQVWGSIEYGPNLVTTPENIKANKNLLVEEGDVHLYSIIAISWVEAMTEFYRNNDWGEYKPPEDV